MKEKNAENYMSQITARHLFARDRFKKEKKQEVRRTSRAVGKEGILVALRIEKKE